MLSVEKQLALSLYFLKDQGFAFYDSKCFWNRMLYSFVIVLKVCDVIARVLGPKYIKLPPTEQQMKDIVKGMEDKYEFPQAFGCVDGTHIAINQPTENPHDYFSYKQKYTLNVQAVCDWRGLFIDC